MINNSTASSNNVDDGQADEPANIPEAMIDSNKEFEKEQQERSKSSKPRSKKARAKPLAETLAYFTYYDQLWLLSIASFEALFLFQFISPLGYTV